MQVFLVKNIFDMVKKRSDCPISCSLDIFGDKWSLLIIRDLMFKGSCTYGDFQKSDEKIATNILAARLSQMEENGLISKSNHPDSRAKVLYKLTQKGIDLLPILVEIQLWADKYVDLTPERRAIIESVKKDKNQFIATQMDALVNIL